MVIRNKLSLQFTIIFALILLVILSVSFYIAYNFSQREFYSLLEERAFVTSQYFLEEDELTPMMYEPYKIKFKQPLPEEIIQIYDETNQNAFVLTNNRVKYPEALLNKIRKEKSVRFKQKERQAVGIYYLDNQGDFVIIVSAIDMHGKAKLNNLLTIMIISFIGSIFIIYLLGLYFAERALHPIRVIVNQVKKITVSNLDLRIDEGESKDEINELAVTFNDMLSRLESAFSMQRDFITNASHELRTPVTAAISEIEILLSRKRTNEDYRNTLVSVLAEFEKLKELTNNMLSLAQANFDSSVLNFKDVRVDELLWEAKEDAVKKIENTNISIEYLNMPEDPSEMTIQGNQQLLEVALSNIIQNACKFSNNENVICELKYTQDNIYIRITDKGIGIALKEISNIFQPFYRAKNALKFEGYGIGLSLSEKIIWVHEGDLGVKSKLNKGTTFIITLPTSKAKLSHKPKIS